MKVQQIDKRLGPVIGIGLALALASPAAARFISTDSLAPTPVTGCALSSCAGPSDLGVPLGLVYDPVVGLYDDVVGLGAFADLYIYDDGIVSFGKALPSTATIGDAKSLGNAFAAPGFADYDGTGTLGGIEVQAYFQSDGTFDPNGYLNVTVRGVDIFWTLTNAAIFAVSLNVDCAPGNCFEYGSQLGDWYLGGAAVTPYLPAGALIGVPGHVTTMPAVNGAAFLENGAVAAPEPATWIMMLIGFCGLGARLRARADIRRQGSGAPG